MTPFKSYTVWLVLGFTLVFSAGLWCQTANWASKQSQEAVSKTRQGLTGRIVGIQQNPVSLIPENDNQVVRVPVIDTVGFHQGDYVIVRDGRLNNLQPIPRDSKGSSPLPEPIPNTPEGSKSPGPSRQDSRALTPMPLPNAPEGSKAPGPPQSHE